MRRHLAVRLVARSRRRAERRREKCAHQVKAWPPRAPAPTGPGHPMSAWRCDVAALDGGCGDRPIALYQSIILAVKYNVSTPPALTASCTPIAESYSDNRKWPSADNRIPRQKI